MPLARGAGGVIHDGKPADLQKSARIVCLQQHTRLLVLAVEADARNFHHRVEDRGRDRLHLHGVGVGEGSDEFPERRRPAEDAAADAARVFDGNERHIDAVLRHIFRSRREEGVGRQVAEVGLHDARDGYDAHIPAPERGIDLAELGIQKRALAPVDLVQERRHLRVRCDGGEVPGGREALPRRPRPPP